VVDEQHVGRCRAQALGDVEQRAGRQHVAGVEKPDVVAGGVLEPEVARLRVAHRGREVVDADPRVALGERIEQLRGMVGRGVVDGHQLDVLERLPEDRLREL
jgi:hypothetical protein